LRFPLPLPLLLMRVLSFSLKINKSLKNKNKDKFSKLRSIATPSRRILKAATLKRSPLLVVDGTRN